MEELKGIWMYILGILGVVATIVAYLAPPGEHFRTPEQARIFFWHFPCSIVFTGMMFWALYLCVQSLRFKSLDWDRRASAANELGALFTVLVMATGIIFSKAEWGEYWSWDPKQSSFLMVNLLYLAYFVLRASIADPQTRATNSAVYWCFGTPAVFFLTFIFPNLPWVEAMSLHPSGTIVKGELSVEYQVGIYLTLTLFIWFSVVLYQQRVAVEALKQTLEDM